MPPLNDIAEHWSLIDPWLDEALAPPAATIQTRDFPDHLPALPVPRARKSIWQALEARSHERRARTELKRQHAVQDPCVETLSRLAVPSVEASEGESVLA